MSKTADGRLSHPYIEGVNAFINFETWMRIDAHYISIDVTSRWYENDHFILPRQARQVFYLQDTKLGEPWKIVQSIQQR